MDSGSVMHRWCNKDFGKRGTLTASSSCHAEGRTYYSYSTVFGQWLDMKKNVVCIFDGSTSNTSSRYKLWKGMFPDEVHVFPLDFRGGSYYYGGWRNCNLVGRITSDEDFKESHRFEMLDHYVGRLYNQFALIVDGNSRNLDNVSFVAWEYIEELCSLYRDTTVKKWLKRTSKHGWKDENTKEKKVMVNLLYKGERDVKVITDAMFGEGTYDAYMGRCKRFTKSDVTKQKTITLCHRLGFSSPYRGWSEGGYVPNPYSASQIRNLTAAERNRLHFKNLMELELVNSSDKRCEKMEKVKWNAFRWITGHDPLEEERWYKRYKLTDVKSCRNMFTGEEYDLSGDRILGFYWAIKEMNFSYESFAAAEDKTQWILNFYAQCREAQDNRNAISTLKRIGAHVKNKKHSWDDDIFIDDDFLKENTTEEEYALCKKFIKKQDKHYADEEARRRAEEIARLQREEEKRREEEFRSQVKKEQIDECIARGAEGCRDLWRNHLMEIYDSENRYIEEEFGVSGCAISEFYYGGNVLLRLNLPKTYVETSKHIRVPVEVCKKMWKIVSRWHEDPTTFKSMVFDTKGNGKYTISSYEDDIMTAGCHKISYVEMERMYNQILAECE